MPASADSTLLDRYAYHDDAFAAFMRRHLDMVYSAALRQTSGDSHRAHLLAGHALITGWLHRTTGHVAAELRRSESRRRRHETAQAVETALLVANPTPEPTICWESLGPLLDDALDSLGDKGRETILLRYFARKPFADIGATLGLTEAAAQMRAARALAVNWGVNLSAPDAIEYIRTAGIECVLDVLVAVQAPEKGVDWAEGLLEGANRRQVLHDSVRQLARANPQAALAYANIATDPEGKRSLLTGVALG